MNDQSGGFEITEFPFFTFLFADLHAHLIVIPFALLSVSLTFALYTKILKNDSYYGQFLLALLLGIILGSIRIINTWDFPTQLLLSTFIIFFGYLLYSKKTRLERLSLSECPGLKDPSLHTLTQTLPKLKWLDLRYCRNITRKAIKQLCFVQNEEPTIIP